MKYKKPRIMKIRNSSVEQLFSSVHSYHYVCVSENCRGKGDTLWEAWDDWHCALEDEAEFQHWLDLEISLSWKN